MFHSKRPSPKSAKTRKFHSYIKNVRGGSRRRKLICSPHDDNSFLENTCLDKNTISELYKHTRPYIISLPNVGANYVDKSLNYSQMLKKVRQKSKCKDDLCILTKSALLREKKNKALTRFAPLVPVEWYKNDKEWLSSVDIENVLKQYESVYKCFEFIGPSPIDFDSSIKYQNRCVCNKLCNFSLKKCIVKSIRKVGIIFNLDTSDEPGSHWVSLFVNIKKNSVKSIEQSLMNPGPGGPMFHTECSVVFFDSTGEPAPNEIMVLVSRIQSQANNLGLPFTFLDIQHEHQQKDTECGVYSLYFIINMLENTPNTVQKLQHSSISDKVMQRFRHKYFNYIK